VRVRRAKKVWIRVSRRCVDAERLNTEATMRGGDHYRCITSSNCEEVLYMQERNNMVENKECGD
jgi:hypothetical protein